MRLLRRIAARDALTIALMLARDRALMDSVKLVSAITRGRAYFTITMTLGQFILMDFLEQKTKTVS